MTVREYLQYDDVRIIPCDRLPVSVKACCYHDDDCNEYILVNPIYSRKAQRESVRHEVAHLIKGEMYNKAYHEY